CFYQYTLLGAVCVSVKPHRVIGSTRGSNSGWSLGEWQTVNASANDVCSILLLLCGSNICNFKLLATVLIIGYSLIKTFLTLWNDKYDRICRGLFELCIEKL